MKKLSEYPNEKLLIVQPALFKRNFELRSQTELLTTLSYPSFWSRGCLVEGDLTGSWEFYFPSFWKPVIEIRAKGSELPIAKYTRKLFSLSQSIELPNGEKVILRSFAFKPKKEIQTEAGEILLTFNFIFSLKYRMKVVIAKKSELLDKYPWLIMLVFFIISQQRKNRS